MSPKLKVRLTQRETECLQLVAGGNTDVDIARRLGLSPSTIHFHVENAKKKLQAKTRAQAAALAVHLRHISL